MKTFLSLTLAILSLPASAADLIPILKTSKTLSPEGQRKKATHDYLFDTFAKERKTTYRGEGKDKGLKELTILKETLEIRHGDELALPAGTEKIAGLFRHFAFHGADLDLIKEVRVFPFSPDSAPPRSKQVKDFYRVQMPSLPLTDKPYEPMKIRFLMEKENDVCRIDDLVFIAQKQIPPAFDDISYRDLGSEHPRERVEITVDTTHELSIGGSSELQRKRWFRTHTTPGSTHQSFEKWALERGFYPARGFMKFNPALTKGWGKNPATLQERKDKPGSVDLTFFDRYDAGTSLRQAIPEYKATPFTSCFNDWPEFMSVPLTGRGTPLADHFDQAAELAANYVADQVKDAGYTAAWWEVKNESSVQSEWAHHWQEKQGIDGWGLLADFHNRVASAIHKSSPDTKVGGPSSAYMQVQVGDFKLFRDQARFITETKGHLDFFSHHFYENSLTLGAHERRGLGYSNYLLGRYEAILDMLRAHMHKVDNVLPILITECGSLQNGREPSDNWLRLHAWNSYLIKSMQRPDQIDLFIPFIFLHMPWNPISGDAAFTPKAGIKRPWAIDDFEPSTMAHIFELWRDFDGRRLPVSFDRDWLDVVAVHDGKGVSLAVTNMGGRQLNLDLSQLAKKLGAKTAQQTRLNYHKGEVVFEPRHEVTASAIPIDVNETTVIRITATKHVKPAAALTLDRWYAHETAIPSAEKSQSFIINIEKPKAIQHARLIIGAHRRGGLTEALTVKINGHPIVIDLGDADEFSEFFAPLETTIPIPHLRKDNQIEITSQTGTTITSVQILTHRSLAQGAQPAIVDLFAKNDLSQWWTDKKDREGKWSVKDGVASRGETKAGGLSSKAKPFNFELTFEWKIAEGGNSGIIYRGGLEYQLLDDERHIRGKTPNSSVAALYDLVAPAADKPSKPAGQWNTGRIIAKGNHIEHWLNGVKVLEIEQKTAEWKALIQKSKYNEKPDFGTKASGIHLQDHGANVHFRKVLLRDLSAKTSK